MGNDSLAKKGILGMGWMMGSTIISYVIQLIITAVLARYLTPTVHGEIAAINVLIGFAEIFWMVGIGPAIVQKQTLTKDDIYTGNTLNIFLGLGIYLIIFLFANPLCKLFNISNSLILRVFSIIFLLNSFSGISKSLLQKKCNYKVISIIKVLGIVVYGCVSVVLVFCKFEVWSLVIATLVQNLFMTIAYYAISPVKPYIMIKKESLHSLLYFGGGFTLARIFNYIANNGDTYCVNKTMGKADVGFYSKAYQLLMYPTSLIGDSLDQVCFPLLAKKQDNKKWLYNVFEFSTMIVFIFALPISIFCFVCAEDIIHFIYGNNWDMTIIPFKIFIMGLFFRIGYKISDSLVRALGKVYKRSLYQIIYAFFVIFGSLAGKKFGIAGVATGVTVAFTINYFLMTNLSLKLLEKNWMDIIGSFGFPLLCGGITMISVIIIKNKIMYNIHGMLSMLVLGIIIVIVYTVPFYIFKRKLIYMSIDYVKNTLIKK